MPHWLLSQRGEESIQDVDKYLKQTLSTSHCDVEIMLSLMRSKRHGN